MKSIKKVKIIAEIGVNHNGNVKKAKKLIDVAKSAGADFVKFQVFDSENLVKVTNDKNSSTAESNFNNQISLNL